VLELSQIHDQRESFTAEKIRYKEKLDMNIASQQLEKMEQMNHGDIVSFLSHIYINMN